jgi:hypothetical protein
MFTLIQGGCVDSPSEHAVRKLAAGGSHELREDGEFVLYRDRRGSIDGVLNATLMVAPISEHVAPRSLHRIEHEYSLRAELDSAWAVRPLAIQIDFMREACATETAELTFACYSTFHIIKSLLVRSDALDAMWRESGEKPPLRPQSWVPRCRKY